jgi:hypothetical protein
MPAARRPDGEHAQACLAATKGPRPRACAGIMAAARGPAQMAPYAGITRRGERARTEGVSAQAGLAAARVLIGGRGRAKAGVARDALPMSRSRSQSSSWPWSRSCTTWQRRLQSLRRCVESRGVAVVAVAVELSRPWWLHRCRQCRRRGCRHVTSLWSSRSCGANIAGLSLRNLRP